MTLLEQLQTHKGGLILLKTELFWYGPRGWDRRPGRLCVLLDTPAHTVDYIPCAAFTATAAAFTSPRAPALLLIDGSPRWVWMAGGDVELLNAAG